MTRLLPPERDDRPPEEPTGHIANTRIGPLVGLGVVAMVAGWAIRPLSIEWNFAEPTVPWLTVFAVWFAAAVIGGAAYLTWHTVHRRQEHIEAHKAVNRLVLGKACALAGAVIAGGYFGFAVAHLGIVETELSSQRIWHSAIAGVGGLVVTCAALLLERACRVHDDRR